MLSIKRTPATVLNSYRLARVKLASPTTIYGATLRDTVTSPVARVYKREKFRTESFAFELSFELSRKKTRLKVTQDELQRLHSKFQQLHQREQPEREEGAFRLASDQEAHQTDRRSDEAQQEHLQEITSA